MESLELNGKKFYYEEIGNYAFRESLPINGYEAKVLEFCRNWLNGQQEFVVHTSGSTGPPKDIVLTRTQMEASARQTLQALDLQSGDRAFVCLNTEAVSGLMMLVRGLVGDLHLTVIEPIANPLAFSKTEKPYDFISLVPYQLQTMLSETPVKKQVLDYAKAILLGGAPVSSALEKRVQSLKAPVYLTYGMTETCSHIAWRRLNGKTPDHLFRAFPEIELGQDERGCLTIRGEVTNQQLVVTNDLVTLHSDGQFTWEGRADNTINTGGYKVQLEKLEVVLAQALLELHFDHRCLVAALPDPKLGSRLVAVLEGKPLTNEQEKALKGALAHFLNKYELPREFHYIPVFASTVSGKIDKVLTLQKVTV